MYRRTYSLESVFSQNCMVQSGEDVPDWVLKLCVIDSDGLNEGPSDSDKTLDMEEFEDEVGRWVGELETFGSSLGVEIVLGSLVSSVVRNKLG